MGKVATASASPSGATAEEPRLSSGRLLVLGLQHVLVMYAGTVSVPLIVGGALRLPKDQLAYLINADLFASGIATLIQSLGFWQFGIRLPVMMGLSTLFAWTSAIVGLYLSYYLDVAAGAAVASATVALFLIAALAGALRGT